jgi:L-alanine-DL-glutamate epimerase-like enolase superfamily enzyme
MPERPADPAPRLSGLDAWTVPFVEPNDHGNTRYVTLCRLRDADGVVGWGEAVTIQEEAADATTAVLRGWAAHLVDHPATPAALRAFVQQRGWWYGTGGGIAGFASAAVDTAAWDLLARRAGMPLVDVLGGAVHDVLPTVVVTHATLADLQQQADAFARWSETAGAVGVKVGFGKPGEARLGWNHDRDVAFVAALRAALGTDALLMVDCSPQMRWSVPQAIRRVRAFEEHGLHWIEEPLGHDDPSGYARLQAATSTLIAYGERAWTVAEMDRLLDTGTLDVLGIDAGRAGGISGFVEGARLAHLRGRQANAHAFAGPVSYAAGLACSLVSPACRQFEVAPLRNTLMTELAPDLPTPSDGVVAPLPGPGLGVKLDETTVIGLSTRR